MKYNQTSGRAHLKFVLREDLYTLPAAAKEYESDLHGGFAIDDRPDYGEIYFGMPGIGLMRVDADLKRQSIIRLHENLVPVNFHSTKIGEFEGKRRLFLPANNDSFVAILSLDGEIDFIISKPEFEQYQSENNAFHPTDTILWEQELFIADGYGSNYISTFDLNTRSWGLIFGGTAGIPPENGKFNTAHGIHLNPFHNHLDIADRPNSRIQAHAQNGRFLDSHKFPQGAFLCGTSYIEFKGRWYGVIGCLQDPVKDRPAPIYIFDANSYDLLSTIRPKEELGVEPAQHLHNVIFHLIDDQLFLICQSWNPGHYFVLQMI